MIKQTLDDIYPDRDNRPHSGDASKRLAYVEQVLKHIMALGNNGCDYERMKESAEEALGWRAPFETNFALEKALKKEREKNHEPRPNK